MKANLKENGESWRFVHTGRRSPAENMAVDEAMMIAFHEGRTPPTVRFYGWNPPTLSIGYFQRAEREVNLKAVRERGIGFVRRATGGRAVLHDQELTYSIIVSESHPGIPASVTESYRFLSEGLLSGFKRLGLEAGMAGLHRADGASETGSRSEASACFDTPSRYELVVEGRKIAGSAQMRSKGVILQHGSVLLEIDSRLLFDLLQFTDDTMKERMRMLFERKAVTINACLRVNNRPPVTLQDVEKTFRRGFAEGLGVNLSAGALSEYEEELAARLVRHKYGTDDWNLRR